VFLNWLKRQWSSASVYGIYSDKPRMIVVGVHRAQKTEKVKLTLRTQHSTIAMIPSSLVQPLDVVVSAPFKRMVKEYAEQHYEANITNWMNGKYTSSERRVLMTKWVADAGTHICTTQPMRLYLFPGFSLKLPDYPYLYPKGILYTGFSRYDLLRNAGLL